MAKYLIKTDKNGTKYWGDDTCPRCAGRGGCENWIHTGWTCWNCGGTGVAPKPTVWKEYTPEYEAKLNARRAAKQAKKDAEITAKADEINAEFFRKNGFNAEGKTYAVLGNTYSKREELKALGCKFNETVGWHADHELEGFATTEVSVDDCYNKDNTGVYVWTNWKMDGRAIVAEANRQYEIAEAKKDKSEYVGTVGDKIGTEATLVNVARFDTKFGTTNVYTFRDIFKNVFVWKTSGVCEKVEADGKSLRHVEVGERVELQGTVKDHNEYKGIKQTVLTRCKIK